MHAGMKECFQDSLIAYALGSDGVGQIELRRLVCPSARGHTYRGYGRFHPHE
jgi:hypothetical protein